jgi:quinol monooxygenase YgiN
MGQEVTVIARFKAKSGKEARVGEILRALIEPTRAEDGCKFYRLFSANEIGLYYFFELWESAEALAKHAESKHILVSREALKDQLEVPLEVSILTELSAH